MMPPKAEVGSVRYAFTYAAAMEDADRHAAGIRVFDDDARRGVELAHAFERGIAVRNVVVGQLLALQLPGLRHRGADRARIGVERRLLVRVLAISKIEALGKREIQIVGERRRFGADRAGEICGDHGIVLRSVGERLGRELLTHADVGGALIGRELIEERAIIRGIDHDRDRGVILGRRPDHGGAADVDVLDSLVISTIGAGHGRSEGVEIHRQQIDGLDVVLAHDFLVHAAAPEKTAVNFRVQRLDAAAHDFRKAGVLRDFLDWNTVANQEVGGATGGQKLDAPLSQLARKLDDPGLV